VLLEITHFELLLFDLSAEVCSSDVEVTRVAREVGTDGMLGGQA
jgi:hypothetical protein